MLRSKYKNLVIIGNGFDRWQNLPTSYEEFRKYYIVNIDKVMEEQGFSRCSMIDEEGNEKQFTAVELIYGDPFNLEKLSNEFFWNFEAELDKLDDQQINLFFGRSEKGVEELGKLVAEAQSILRTMFCRWVLSLHISKEESDYHFPDNCFFINFNYTDTLEKRFGVNSRDVYHIHGSADDESSIVVGHSSHPETAFQELKERHFIKSLRGDRLPRIDGLYAVEEALYQTDKHVEDNIDSLCAEMLRRGVHIEDIENIYVLGHSFGEPDLGYFEYLDKVTRCGCDYDHISAAERIDLSTLAFIASDADESTENILLEQIFLNIQYATHHRDRTFVDAPSFYPLLDAIDEAKGLTYRKEEAEKAVKQRFLFEQAGRTNNVLKELARENGLKDVPDGCHSVLGLADFLDWGHEPRKRNATWHITCYSTEAEKKVKSVMKMFRQKRYTLYSTIDECIETLK